VKEKRSSTPGKFSVAKPASSSGVTAPKPITIYVEKIWSEEYCRQHPQNAAQAIETLQMLLDDRDGQVAALKHAIEDIRKLLDERI
jgi:N-methylhydantoinase B/oxoprolinase/acetone carboxylase alpha subunit